ncbi:MAG: sigma-70 family RNA polymerase sigma factor [Minicystis sp.]
MVHVSEGRRAPFAAVPDLEAALADLADAGRRAWPEIAVEPADFVAFLGRCLSADAAPRLRSIRAAELYLVCAYGLGVPGASDALEEHYMPRVRAALVHVGTPPATIADVQQELRQRLVEASADEPARRGYEGRGDLVAWLCISAVRAGSKRRERGKRERSLGEAESVLLAAPEGDPELSHLRSSYQAEFQAAFQRALAALTSRERNLLRYHLIEGRSIDQLGALYGVHRSTAARWINEARESLRLRTRDLLAERVSLSQEGFHRLLSLIESQIDVGAALAAT